MRARSLSITAAALCLVLAAPTRAGGADVPLDMMRAQGLAQQIAAVRAGLQPGGRYATLNTRDRYLVVRDLDAMSALLDRNGGLRALSDAERVRLFNAQENADRLLTGDPNGWWTCALTPPTGSHLPRTLCWAQNGS